MLSTNRSFSRNFQVAINASFSQSNRHFIGVLLVGLLLLGGCGTNDSANQNAELKTTAKALFKAVVNRDPVAICRYVAWPDIPSTGSSECINSVKNDLNDSEAALPTSVRIRKVTTSGDTGTVRVTLTIDRRPLRHVSNFKLVGDDWLLLGAPQDPN